MMSFAARPSEGKQNEDITSVLVCCLYGSEGNTWTTLKTTRCLLLLPSCLKICLHSEKTAQRRERGQELPFCLLKPGERLVLQRGVLGWYEGAASSSLRANSLESYWA